MSLTTINKLPGVLSFNRCHVVSDGTMWSRLLDGKEEPVMVVRHGIRGTQNISGEKGVDDQKTANNGKHEISNIQITETAKLAPNASALVVRFTLAMLDLDSSLDSCIGADRESAKMLRATIADFVTRAKGSKGLLEVARRYARNIANGRWLWRNRAIASAIEITVMKRNGEKIASFDALSIPLNQFNDYLSDEHALAAEIAAQMRGDSLDGLEIEAVITPRVTGNIEVFPSQNYIKEKPDGFARPLYKIGQAEPLNVKSAEAFRDTRITGQAALRDQKIFNAIRTVDTWYPAYEEIKFPIAVEPQGASLAQQEFYRKGKDSSFQIFLRLVQVDPDHDEGMFCIAALDRGGVYGVSDKKEKEKKQLHAEEVVEETE